MIQWKQTSSIYKRRYDDDDQEQQTFVRVNKDFNYHRFMSAFKTEMSAKIVMDPSQLFGRAKRIRLVQLLYSVLGTFHNSTSFREVSLFSAKLSLSSFYEVSTSPVIRRSVMTKAECDKQERDGGWCDERGAMTNNLIQVFGKEMTKRSSVMKVKESDVCQEKLIEE